MENKLDKKVILDELKITKEEMQESFDTQLGHIKVTKEELKNLKKQLTQFPKYVVDREIKYYHILKKLGVVEKEKGLYDRLDIAIKFLEEQINNFPIA